MSNRHINYLYSIAKIGGGLPATLARLKPALRDCNEERGAGAESPLGLVSGHDCGDVSRVLILEGIGCMARYVWMAWHPWQPFQHFSHQ